MLDQPHAPASRADEAPTLAERLDALSTWLFMAAGLVVVCTVIGAVLVLTTTIDTFGIVSSQVEGRGRFAAALIVFGFGIAGAGVVAGLAGILKALVRRREL